MKNIDICKDNIKVRNIILIVFYSFILLLGISFFFDKYITFLDGCEIFYIVMLLYFGIEFSVYLLTRKSTGMHHLYIALACIIASFSGIKYIDQPSNYVIGFSLAGWILIMLIIKLIRIEDLRNELDYRIFFNIFSMSLFILLGFLVVTNIFVGISNKCLILGFFFTSNGVLNMIDLISEIKLKK